MLLYLSKEPSSSCWFQNKLTKVIATFYRTDMDCHWK